MFGEIELTQQGRKEYLPILLAVISEEAIKPSWRKPGLYTDQSFFVSKDCPSFQCPVTHE